MAAINKGLALVSVADVMFFDPTSDEYIGEGLALTNSTITQEVQSIEQRGGYLNALLFDIKHSKNITVELESATFKMEYLGFQTGTLNKMITANLDGIYHFNECVTFTNGVGSTEDTPIGNVFVKLPTGGIKTVTPTGKNIDIGMPEYNGSLPVVYMYNGYTERITIDTKSQPMVVKAIMKVHVIDQDGVTGYLQITIPRLKFNGSITLTMTSDAVSTFNLGGTAEEYAPECGEGGYYALVDYIQDEKEEVTPVSDIVASPNVLTLSLAGVNSATANIIGLRTTPIPSITLDNTKVTFASSDEETVTVTNAGVITGVKEGTAQVTATYEGLQDIISVTVGA